MSKSIDSLYNEMFCLCEVSGQLSPEDNAKVAARIRELQKQIAAAEVAEMEELVG